MDQRYLHLLPYSKSYCQNLFHHVQMNLLLLLSCVSPPTVQGVSIETKGYLTISQQESHDFCFCVHHKYSGMTSKHLPRGQQYWPTSPLGTMKQIFHSNATVEILLAAAPRCGRWSTIIMIWCSCSIALFCCQYTLTGQLNYKITCKIYAFLENSFSLFMRNKNYLAIH